MIKLLLKKTDIFQKSNLKMATIVKVLSSELQFCLNKA